MKKFLGGLGLVALLLVSGFIVWKAMGPSLDGPNPEAFFQALNAGDVAALEQMMSPSLRAQMDPVILAALVKEVREVLGTYVGPGPGGFEIRRTVSAGEEHFTKFKGIARFSRGEAPCLLSYRENELLSFDIQSDEVMNRTFRQPEVLDDFQAQGRRFLELALSGSADEAYALCHEKLQAEVSKEQFQEAVRQALAAHGAFRSASPVTLRNEVSTTGRYKMIYDIFYEKDSMTAEVDFFFDGTRSRVSDCRFAM